MTAKELAARLNGREYPGDVMEREAAMAKAAGLVVVFGASDDLAEFRGAINDEVGCYGGRDVHLTSRGLVTNRCEEDCPYFARELESAVTIEALWCKDGDWSWTYKTDIPHETFEILEDGKPYCRGIVFALADVDKGRRVPGGARV